MKLRRRGVRCHTLFNGRDFCKAPSKIPTVSIELVAQASKLLSCFVNLLDKKTVCSEADVNDQHGTFKLTKTMPF